MKRLDYINGNIPKTLILFFIPCFFTYFFRYLYNALDIFILANNVEQGELSVVLTGFTPVNLCIALLIGIATGGTFLIGQYHGAGDRKSRDRVTTTFVSIMIMIGVVLMLLLVFLSPLIVQWLNMDPKYQHTGIKFLHISALSIPLFSLCYALSGVSRGVGKSVFPMVYVLLACAFNMLFDYLFINVGKFGSLGTAWSMLAAASTTALIMCSYLLKIYGFKRFTKFKFRKVDISRIARYSLPTSIQEVMLIICFAVLVSTCNYRGFSTELVISDRITELTFSIVYGMYAALTSIVAQNLGAYRADRAKDYLKWGIIFCLILSIAVLPVYCCFDQIALLYTDDKAIAREVFNRNWFLYGQLILCSFAYPLMSLQCGSGHPYKAMLMFIVPTIAVQVPIFLALGYNGGSFSMMAIGYPSCEIIIVIIGYILFKKGGWKSLKTLPVTQDIAYAYEHEKLKFKK